MASNRDLNLIELAEHTGTQTGEHANNLNNPSAHFVTNITSLSSGQTLTLNVYGVTETGAEYIIFTSLPMNQVTTYRQALGPAFECVPGIACRDFIPKHVRAEIVPSIPAQADTYSFDLVLGLG